MYKHHWCFVFERLGLSLFDCIEKNTFRGYYVTDIQVFARHMLESLCFLHDMKLTHTDLKPENVLLVDRHFDEVKFPRGEGTCLRPRRADVKLIDFGGATFEHEKHTTIINTRHYRAPEVILGNGWSMSSDMWSVACVLTELYSGELLFSTHDDGEHLAMIEKVAGSFPLSMIETARPSTADALFVNQIGELRWYADADSTSRKNVRKCMRLEEIFLKRHSSLRELVCGLLVVDPNRRPTAHDALKHPFFNAQPIE
eukprot:GHVR01114245.1.p1 GENE.GHVR01114245.1~~GHVR01114245.1.p1  ORF type:complete len:256 (+),score=45.25 GHVR01114245.1:476-1243(+)